MLPKIPRESSPKSEHDLPLPPAPEIDPQLQYPVLLAESQQLFPDPFYRPPDPKNIFGNLGEKCSNCSGVGKTIGFHGKSLWCQLCSGSGIKSVPSHIMLKYISALEERVAVMERTIAELRRKN